MGNSQKNGNFGYIVHFSKPRHITMFSLFIDGKLSFFHSFATTKLQIATPHDLCEEKKK